MSGQIKLKLGTESQCAHCQKTYNVRHATSQYCCRKCYLDDRSEKARAEHTLNCKHCGKPFYRPPSRQIGGFCSHKCHGESKRLPETITCPKCGGPKAWGAEVCNPCWGKSRRLGQFHPCGQCGKDVWKSPAQLAAVSRIYGVFCSQKCFGLSTRGEQHLQYVNGSSTVLYPADFYAARPKVRKRENHCCFLCSKKLRLDVHHIDRDTMNNDMSNLVALCRTCHRQQHYQAANVPLAKTATQLARQLSAQLSEKYGYPMRSITLKSPTTTTTLLKAS